MNAELVRQLHVEITSKLEALRENTANRLQAFLSERESLEKIYAFVEREWEDSAKTATKSPEHEKKWNQIGDARDQLKLDIKKAILTQEKNIEDEMDSLQEINSKLKRLEKEYNYEGSG